MTGETTTPLRGGYVPPDVEGCRRLIAAILADVAREIRTTDTQRRWERRNAWRFVLGEDGTNGTAFETYCWLSGNEPEAMRRMFIEAYPDSYAEYMAQKEAEE